ncbi:hypothetical protein C2G38_2033470 [Gigaspora rosea]|uniref:Uncharacterized protein n=1 Tax=Gigaspora rosea TaxID=44941 RepID=A0A397VJA6_9GLOM|nr:hypothetical protein C2G38_2033470 [Gigaspora rosea]
MDPNPDFKKARKWNQERLRPIHINNLTITKVKFNHGNKTYDFEKVGTLKGQFLGGLNEFISIVKILPPQLTQPILNHFPKCMRSEINRIITEQEFISLKETLLSDLLSDWKVLEPPVERCMHSIAIVDENGLKKVAKTAIYHGICGAIKEIQMILGTSNKIEEDNPFLVSPATEITTSNDVIKDGDTYHPAREIVSRASRQHRILAIGASDKAEGDWHFTDKHDLAKDLTWGKEFSLCERAGSKIENGKKILDNTFKVQKPCEICIKPLWNQYPKQGWMVIGLWSSPSSN